MDYQKFKPCPELALFIECYFVWKSVSGPVDNMVVESPPNGFCSMVFNMGAPYFVQSKKYPRLAVPAQFIAGQTIYSYQLQLNGNINIAGIVFKPAALATLFGLHMYHYVEERMDLYNVLDKNMIDEIIGQLQNQMVPIEKARLLETFILGHLHLHKPAPDFIDKAANRVVAQNGLLHIHELLKESYMSRRTFERRFFQKVGLSPKYYARIRRISYLCNCMAGKKKVEWAKLFYECAYYDQAHFIKDFEEFTGRSPQQYLKENNELANFLEKPGTQSLG